MLILQRRKARAAALATLLTAPIAGFEAPAHGSVINTNDIVAEQVGNGAAALTNASTAVFLDIYTPTFFSNGSVSLTAESTPQIALPTVSSVNGLASNPLTTSGNSTAEGQITLSADGQYVLVPGYDANVGLAGSVVATNSATIPRAVALVNVSGAIDTSTTTTAFNNSNIRSAATSDDVTIYAGGAVAPGITAITVDTTNGNGTQLQNTVVNTRQLQIYNNTIYVSDSSGNTVHLGSITGFNGTANSGSLTELPGTSANNAASPTGYEIASPYGYAFDDGGSVLYLVDQSGNGNNGSGSGVVEKFLLSGGLYTFDGFVPVGSNNATGLTIEDAVINGTTLETAIFVTTPAEIYEITDTGGSLTGDTLNPEIAVGANEAFRGIVAVPEPATLSLMVAGATLPLLARRRRKVKRT